MSYAQENNQLVNDLKQHFYEHLPVPSCALGWGGGMAWCMEAMEGP